MYRKLDESMGRMLGFKLRKTFTEAELEELAREIELTFADQGQLDLMLEFEELEALPEVDIITREHKFISRFGRRFRRLACVADEKWHEWWDRFTATFSNADARFFTPLQRREGIDWVRHK